MITITRVESRIIKVIPGTPQEFDALKKITRLYNPRLRYTKAGKNRDID